MQIGVLDHERSQRELVCQSLGAVANVFHSFASGREMQQRLPRDSIDLLVLDWQVVDISGAEILHWARQHISLDLPVLFMVCATDQDAIAAGLAAGANDFLVKPIRRDELAARALALLRAAYPAQFLNEKIQCGLYAFDRQKSRALMGNQLIELTQKEFDLAWFLFHNIGRPLSRATIQEAIWSRDNDIPSRTLDTHVSRIRTKLQLRAENGFRLEPVYSFGYRLEQLAV